MRAQEIHTATQDLIHTIDATTSDVIVRVFRFGTEKTQVKLIVYPPSPSRPLVLVLSLMKRL